MCGTVTNSFTKTIVIQKNYPITDLKQIKRINPFPMSRSYCRILKMKKSLSAFRKELEKFIEKEFINYIDAILRSSWDKTCLTWENILSIITTYLSYSYIYCRCDAYRHSWVVDLAVLGLWLDLMILEVFSNLNNSDSSPDIHFWPLWETGYKLTWTCCLMGFSCSVSSSGKAKSIYYCFPAHTRLIQLVNAEKL